MPETLFQETMRLIKESGLSNIEICRATGLKPAWLGRLIDGDYADPGVNKIEKINAFLRRQAGKQA